jgi:hypothetical protein
MTASTLGSPIRLIDTHSGYPFNAGQLEDSHRDLKCRKARPWRLRIQKPEAVMLQSVPPYVDTRHSSSETRADRAADAMIKASNVVKELTEITPLNVPVPPLLSKAIGYPGKARYVSFQWTPYGDEADYSDGRLSGTGNWQGFLAYIQHPAVSPFLKEYDLGSSDSEARHALILDRNKLEIMITPVREAQAFLSAQWPPQPPIRMNKEEYLAMVSQSLKNVKQPNEIDIEEVQRRIEEHYALVEDMQRWLDRFLKN